MSDDRIVVGFVKRAHGIRGAILVVPLSDDPQRFRPGAVFGLIDGPEDVSSLTVTSLTRHNEGVVLRTQESSDRNRAESLAKASLTIEPSERRDLGENEFWPEDLIGRRAVSVGGGELGTVADVVLGDAQDRLVVVTPQGEQVEVPFVAAIVEVPREGAIAIDPPQGLFPD